MLEVMCVLKSGGIYDAEWVRKLRDAVKRNLAQEHMFTCLSDVPVPCNRIPLFDYWPGWWAKIELFKPGVILEPTLYLDLDTVITGPFDISALADIRFAMLRNFWTSEMVGSGVMWFGGPPDHIVYQKFAKQPEAYMKHYSRNADGPYTGDQAFIFDTLGPVIEHINPYLKGIKSYKFHCRKALPEDARLVCFHGDPRPPEVKTEWMQRHWA
jgi:hypothetical protein